jgi:hypothetical protein
MDGGDGSWAYLFGAAPLTPDQVSLALDEDQSADSERRHGTEQVAYVVFDQPLTIN